MLSLSISKIHIQSTLYCFWAHLSNLGGMKMVRGFENPIIYSNHVHSPPSKKYKYI